MPDQPAGRAATVDVRARHQALRPPRARSAGRPGAVNDLSLAVPAGQICVLVGPSGCGKTTSLKMVNRLIEPTAGRILLDGADAATRDVTELRRGIGYVIQQVGLFPHQTIAENVATVPRLLGWPAARRRRARGGAPGARGPRPGDVRAAATRSSSPAASGSASASPGRSPPTRRSCSWTSPSAPSTPSSGSASRTSSCASRRRWPRRSSSSPTTSTRRSRWATSSPSCRTGGVLAQFGPPAEILASPASPFVARFVGADRGLKRLSPEPRRRPRAPAHRSTARVGEVGTEEQRRALADSFPWLLLLDEAGRPVGWIARGDITVGGSLADAPSAQALPLLEPAGHAQGRPLDPPRRRRPRRDRGRPDAARSRPRHGGRDRRRPARGRPPGRRRAGRRRGGGRR